MRRSRRHLIVLAVVSLLLGTGLTASAHRLRLPKPARGMQITIGPIPVPQGQETTECTYFPLKSDKDMAVNRVTIKVRGGSHHIHLYRPYDHSARFPDHRETCNFAL